MTCWRCALEPAGVVTTPCKNGPCQICIAVANVDEEINQFAATLRRLVAKRYDLLSEHNRATDPMHRLPLELTNNIFQLVLPAQDEWGAIVRDGRSSRIVLPSDLTSVCKHWRDIALSNPFLWSTVRITLRKRDSTSDLSGQLKSVQDWILRSRTLPLTLNIAVDPTPGPAEAEEEGWAFYTTFEEEWRRVLDVISPSSSRWQSLSIDIPDELFGVSHHSNLQYTRLRRLQIIGSYLTPNSFPLLNSTMSPKEIDIHGLAFDALQISWNHVTSATVDRFVLEEITQLFQHASRMTHCRIMSLDYRDENFSMPPIIHRSLKALSLLYIKEDRFATILLGSLTLPCLQEFYTDDMDYLTPAHLPALVRRSSCPLTSIRLSDIYPYPDFQPFPGVTNLVLETVVDDPDLAKRLLLEEEYFPDLSYLTLRLRPFLFLWKNGIIRGLLDRKGRLPDASNEGGLHKILVVDQYHAEKFDEMWNTDVGKELKELSIILRDDGFEIGCPENKVK